MPSEFQTEASAVAVMLIELQLLRLEAVETLTERNRLAAPPVVAPPRNTFLVRRGLTPSAFALRRIEKLREKAKTSKRAGIILRRELEWLESLGFQQSFIPDPIRPAIPNSDQDKPTERDAECDELTNGIRQRELELESALKAFYARFGGPAEDHS